MSKKHEGAHKYYRAQFSQSKTIIFRCGKVNCTHFVYKPLILNRLSCCWRCGEEFIITGKTIRNKKFHCENCTRGKEGKIKEAGLIINEEELTKLLGLGE